MPCDCDTQVSPASGRSAATLSEPLSSATSTRPSTRRRAAILRGGRDVVRPMPMRVGAVRNALADLAGAASLMPSPMMIVGRRAC